jgi:hypothetical protein
MTWKKAGSSSVTRTSVRVAEPRVVHRRAANSAAGNRCRSRREIARDKIMSVRGDELRPRNRADQKIVHVRIVLRAGFA